MLRIFYQDSWLLWYTVSTGFYTSQKMKLIVKKSNLNARLWNLLCIWNLMEDMHGTLSNFFFCKRRITFQGSILTWNMRLTQKQPTIYSHHEITGLGFTAHLKSEPMTLTHFSICFWLWICALETTENWQTQKCNSSLRAEAIWVYIVTYRKVRCVMIGS